MFVFVQDQKQYYRVTQADFSIRRSRITRKRMLLAMTILNLTNTTID